MPTGDSDAVDTGDGAGLSKVRETARRGKTRLSLIAAVDREESAGRTAVETT